MHRTRISVSSITLCISVIIYFTDCPGSVNVTISSRTEWPSTTSDQTVELTCIITGVSRDQMEYYWWLIDAINSPIYTFSVSIVANKADRLMYSVTMMFINGPSYTYWYAYDDDRCMSLLNLGVTFTACLWAFYLTWGVDACINHGAITTWFSTNTHNRPP